MLETIIIALVFAKIKGYKIKPILSNWTIYPVIAMEIIFFITQINIFMGNLWIIKYTGILKMFYLCSYLFVIFMYELYINAIIGSLFVFVGGLLNDIAIRVNEGFMPVFPTLSYLTGYVTVEAFGKADKLHILGNEATNMVWLTDVIDLGYSILSIGDVLIRVFVFMIIYKSVKVCNLKTIKTHKKENNICYSYRQ